MVHAISSYRGNRPTNKQMHRQDRLQYTAPLSLERSVTKSIEMSIVNILWRKGLQKVLQHQPQYWIQSTAVLFAVQWLVINIFSLDQQNKNIL